MSEVRVEGDKHVVVVGGGIGGITAALDLASCGVHVTMVEAGPSIGGRIIPLDKTFPTLDCSTCTLSPKMVEVALKKNIDLLSRTRPVSNRKIGQGVLCQAPQKIPLRRYGEVQGLRRVLRRSAPL